jgi:hypothetical protein
MEYALIGLVVVGLAFLVWFGSRMRAGAKDGVRADVAEEVIDGQREVNAARVATADSSTGRADRLQERFTRK